MQKGTEVEYEIKKRFDGVLGPEVFVMLNEVFCILEKNPELKKEVTEHLPKKVLSIFEDYTEQK